MVCPMCVMHEPIYVQLRAAHQQICWWLMTHFSTGVVFLMVNSYHMVLFTHQSVLTPWKRWDLKSVAGLMNADHCYYYQQACVTRWPVKGGRFYQGMVKVHKTKNFFKLLTLCQIKSDIVPLILQSEVSTTLQINIYSIQMLAGNWK